MSAGLHSIQLVAANGTLESPPSTPALSVNLTGASIPSGSSSARASDVSNPRASDPSTLIATTDGVSLRVETLASGLNDVTDLALAPGGWVLVAERAGRIRIYRDGALQPSPAGGLTETLNAGGELLAIAADPLFGTNRWVYAVHTTTAPPESGKRLEFRITRFQEAAGALVNQVTLLSGVLASSPRAAATLRFGPDGRLYAAFDDGGDERAAGDVASFNGKVLRLNPDGTTPADQAGATPVLASDFRDPRGLGWSADGGVLWVCDVRADRSERLTPVVVTGNRPLRAQSREPYGLPVPFGIGGAAFYTASVVREFEGNLFVGADSGQYLLRVRFDPADPLTVVSTERLLADRVGGIRAVAAGADGAIYLSTADTLSRLVPTTTPPQSGSGALRLVR